MSPKVLPVGVLDSKYANAIILVGWVLDKPLDAAKMEAAWSTLIEAWPILVARLRQDAKTKRWEYHIPDKISSEGSFTTMRIHESIHKHYNFSKPSSTIRCTLKENPQHLFTPFNDSSIDDLLKQDMPLNHLQITTFDDASIVGLTIPHILCDAHGTSSVIHALCSILDGKPPPEPLAHFDGFAPFAVNPKTVAAPPSWRVLNTWQTSLLYARSIWDWAFGTALENRDLFIPESDVARIKAQAMEDIREAHGEGTKLWISTSDAILAYCLKLIYASSSSSAPLNVLYIANIRNISRLPSSPIHNSVLPVITPSLPASEIDRLPLGLVALHVRDTLQKQTTEPAIETWLRWTLQNLSALATFFDPWKGEWVVSTNWREMKLMDVDFSAAIAQPSSVENGKAANGDVEKVRPVYVWGNGIQPIPLRNWVGIWADDPRGGMWVSAFLPKRIWDNRDGFGQFISP